MKRQSFLALSLVALLGVTSCDNDSAVVTLPANDGVRTVNFLAHMEENVDVVSRTGVRLKVIHTWQDTKTENIHLFEMDSQGSILEGTNVAIQTEKPYETASFSANFETVASVQTRAGSGYTYTGIIAQRDEDGKYIIPSVQYPTDVNTGTGIDPDADFIIGKAFENETTLDGKTINFEFKRPVAVSRFAITNIEGSYVKSVTITSNNELTGSASYSDIDFANCTVSFTGGSKTLTMEFEDNKLPVSSTTYVNFVSTLGEKEITKVEVATDQYIYTKTKTATLTFNANTFKNIAMDMTVKDGVCTREKNGYKLKRAETVEDGGIYVMVNGTRALQNNAGNVGAVEVTLSNDNNIVTIGYDVTLENLLWTWTSSTIATTYGSYTITNNDEYFYFTGNSGVRTPAIGKYNSTYKNNSVWNYKNSRVENNSNLYLRYNSGWSVSSTQSNTYLYKYVDTREKQSLSFADATPTVDCATNKTFKQIVDGAKTEVTYTISAIPSDAATIDPATGELTLNRKGTVTVTATASASSKYKSSDTSYTLTITNSLSVANKFYEVTEVEAGKEYLIVSNGYALTNSNGTPDGTEVAVSEGVVELDEYDALVWTAGIGNYTGDDYPGFTFSNAGKKLNRNSENIQLTNASSDKYYNFAYDAKSHSFACGTRYKATYYDKTNKKWTTSTNTGGNMQVRLYCSEKPKTNRELAFAESSVSKNLGAESFINILSGYTEGVTFTSTNTDVATVNSTTGQVTVSATNAGTTTITASAPETDTYSAAEVSYTLTVIDPDAVAYYTKVTSALPTSGSWNKVLFVYDNGDGTGYAFKGIYDGVVSEAPGGNTSSNTCYLIEKGNAVEVSITSSGIVSTSEIDACTLTMTFKTENKHNLYMNGIKADFRMLAGTTNGGKFVVMSSAGYRMTYSVSDTGTNNVTASRNDGNKNYYFSFNGTNFVGSTTSSQFCIYKLSE